jgi:hypothetical protein
MHQSRSPKLFSSTICLAQSDVYRAYRHSLITAITVFFQLGFSVGMVNVMRFAGVTPNDRGC